MSVSLHNCIEFEQLLDPVEIIAIIKEWLKSLHCTYYNCENEGEMVFIHEGLNKIYWEEHAVITDYQTVPLKFKNELEILESILNALEWNLIFAQKQMASIRSENFMISPRSLRSEKIEKLESTFKELKNTLNNLLKQVKSMIKPKNFIKKIDMKYNDPFVSLNFIKENWKRWDRLCSEIDSIISEMQKDKQIDCIIQTWINSHKENAEFNDNFEYITYIKVPRKIYEKKYLGVDPSFQSAILIKKFEDKIK